MVKQYIHRFESCQINIKMKNLNILYGINKRKILILVSTKNTFKRSYHQTNKIEMLRGLNRAPVTRSLKDIEKRVSKVEKQIEKKYKEIEESMTLEEMESAQRPHTGSTFWRDTLNSQPVQEAIAASQVIGLGGSAVGGFAFINNKIAENLTEEQKIAVVHSLEKSHVIIEQSDNNIHTLDYWKMDEENNLFKLKTETIPKPRWKRWLGL